MDTSTNTNDQNTNAQRNWVEYVYDAFGEYWDLRFFHAAQRLATEDKDLTWLLVASTEFLRPILEARGEEYAKDFWHICRDLINKEREEPGTIRRIGQPHLALGVISLVLQDAQFGIPKSVAALERMVQVAPPTQEQVDDPKYPFRGAKQQEKATKSKKKRVNVVDERGYLLSPSSTQGEAISCLRQIFQDAGGAKLDRVHEDLIVLLWEVTNALECLFRRDEPQPSVFADVLDGVPLMDEKSEDEFWTAAVDASHDYDLTKLEDPKLLLAAVRELVRRIMLDLDSLSALVSEASFDCRTGREA